jgi:hypothetical protein
MQEGDCFLLDTTTFSTVSFSAIQLSLLFQEGSIAELKLHCMLRFLYPTVVLQGQFLTMSWIFHQPYKTAVFGVRYALRTRCSCMSIFCQGLCSLI